MSRSSIDSFPDPISLLREVVSTSLDENEGWRCRVVSVFERNADDFVIHVHGSREAKEIIQYLHSINIPVDVSCDISLATTLLLRRDFL